MKFVALTVIICCSLTPAATADPWEGWGSVDYCPDGEWAIGFTSKSEPQQGGGDDTSLNAISLKCSGGSWITSAVGPLGNWGAVFLCPSESRLTSCKLRVEPIEEDGDDTAANNLVCKCTFGDSLQGDGISWGNWKEWSNACDKGICALQTRVKQTQGDGDDTPLNDVAFTCCQQ